ncbi:hypothetical protein HYPSUDRAFT_206517 [Hypholoma sublateritium FD-334 SS-4]|uniref:Uncharacterized protein n=1 Tax=Hypholoma sublateritium (strain FD-334 SS-4) TaxID=945553 RepID=A0A0D2NKF0_HYPSF|nr:hypothetical protein HYPSUDRAFT_206517 [Hypholoma sublateritium FD-334 SS-4]
MAWNVTAPDRIQSRRVAAHLHLARVFVSLYPAMHTPGDALAVHGLEGNAACASAGNSAVGVSARAHLSAYTSSAHGGCAARMSMSASMARGDGSAPWLRACDGQSAHWVLVRLESRTVQVRQGTANGRGGACRVTARVDAQWCGREASCEWDAGRLHSDRTLGAGSKGASGCGMGVHSGAISAVRQDRDSDQGYASSHTTPRPPWSPPRLSSPAHALHHSVPPLLRTAASVARARPVEPLPAPPSSSSGAKRPSPLRWMLANEAEKRAANYFPARTRSSPGGGARSARSQVDSMHTHVTSVA